MLRRSTLALLASALAGPAFAQAYPSKPITIVLPYATGGSADMLARFAAQALQTELGKPAGLHKFAGGLVTQLAGEGIDVDRRCAPPSRQ